MHRGRSSIVVVVVVEDLKHLKNDSRVRYKQVSCR
jgi:hypothetical protein